MTFSKRLTREDLLGRTAISYLRWSSDAQEGGSTLQRQAVRLAEIAKHFELTVSQELVDRGLSASKGHHRTKGRLSDLLTAIALGVIPRGTVLIIEAIDRLFREGPLDVFPVLRDMIRTGGLVIVTGDFSIWGEAEIADQG